VGGKGGLGAGGEMTQALYAHMYNNKKKVPAILFVTLSKYIFKRLLKEKVLSNLSNVILENGRA
jgi:hypothetical protein